MKVTFILKDLSEAFYEGSPWTIGFHSLNSLEKLLYLIKLYHRRELKITQKVETGQFRDLIEFNQRMRRGITVKQAKLEPRRGYKLATFEVE